MGHGDTLLNAVIGAVVTIVLSFTGISPILGGGVAGYLQRGSRRDGATVGALSGVFSVVPFLLLIAVGVMFFLAGGVVGVPGGLELLVVAFVLLPVLLVWNIGLAALGGYLGAYVREDTAVGDT